MKPAEEMSDEELAENYKSYMLQIQNDLPYLLDDIHRLRELRKEMNERTHLEVLESVRVINRETEEVVIQNPRGVS